MVNMMYIYKKNIMTQEERNKWQRERRAQNNNAYTKKYEKTRKGFLMRMYRNMNSRINGIQWRKAHLYSGKSLMTKSEFYDFANNDANFNTLFSNWGQSNYDRKLAPSIDRIDSSKGYEIGNVRFVTFSENCRNTSRLKHSNG